VIVRSVKSGLPTNEALRIVAKESPDPVGSEFSRLVEGMKVGITLEQGLKRMYDPCPPPEVGFFSIVMTIQSKSGGNLSEALGNLAACCATASAWKARSARCRRKPRPPP
jgi:tight adherence protein B